MSENGKFTLEFDLEPVLKLSALEVGSLFDAMNNINSKASIVSISEFLAQVVVGGCPKGWGKPSDPATYQKLPFLDGTWSDILNQLTAALNDYSKNLSNSSPST